MLHGISCLIYQVGCCLAQDHPYHIVNIFGTAVEPLREREREREGGREGARGRGRLEHFE